jgi:hemerythrin-like domain-containing protein
MVVGSLCRGYNTQSEQVLAWFAYHRKQKQHLGKENQDLLDVIG